MVITRSGERGVPRDVGQRFGRRKKLNIAMLKMKYS